MPTEEAGGISADRRVHGFRILMILMSSLVTLPAFVMGAQFAGQMPLADTIAACFLGGGVLAIVAAFASVAGARSGLSSYELVLQAFGTTGGRVVNSVLGFVMLGWFGVILMMFGDAAVAALAETGEAVPYMGILLAGAVLMIATTAIGFRALDIFSQILTPFKVGLLVWTVVAAVIAYGWPEMRGPTGPAALTVGQGGSMLAGGVIVGALLTPDICRFARNSTHAAASAAVGFGIGLPLVLIAAAIPALLTGEADLVRIMLGLGLGMFAILIVIAAAWLNNTYNLYATSLVFHTLVPGVSRPWLTVLAGVVGTLAGLAGLASYLVPFLHVLSVAIPPIGGVYIVHAYLFPSRTEHVPPTWRPTAFLCWLAGVLVAAMQAPLGFELSGVSALDSLCVSALAYFGVRRRPS
ncbi:cytosine permease [Sphingosinicella soli]|uniref:Cytosine permease n=1 Tax=Sphingosinicella soli TaxID=333708 RepID=A0A7W7B492_9SPHN|nr:cytosine permease [Sphingosinicella soli]MBB4633744.1 cytosine permease [Sphingosinicella soli]